MKLAAVALHLQPLGPLPVQHQSGCCSPAPTTTGAPTCTTSERLLHWGFDVYDIRADAVALHLQPLGPDLYDIRAAAVALHLQPLGPDLYDIRTAALALHLQPLEPLPVRYQSGCCSPAPTATGDPYLYGYQSGYCSPACTATGSLPGIVRYQSGCCCLLHPTATGVPAQQQYDIRAAAVALHLQPLGVPTCTISERLL
ncbi:hypothetical protein RRG08_055801 [Elysia crispata]|uniref:Uncharacterized protein n=1 Tax=Elysia crispata TaxID=231223 RepID=A0AAE1E7W6_9GAST|nr:hypothetical protein RRG08_055801 [Elysia crispata]